MPYGGQEGGQALLVPMKLGPSFQCVNVSRHSPHLVRKIWYRFGVRASIFTALYAANRRANLRMVSRQFQPPALAFACWHAAHTFCGVAGISSVAPAPPGIASAIAFITVAIAAVVAASPTPFTPSGLVVAGTGCSASRSGGMSSARGIA